MNVAGVIVHAIPEQRERVSQQLAQLYGVEVHTQLESKLVLTVEDDDGQRIANTISQLHTLEGVVSAAMVYQFSDNEEEVSDEHETA